MGLVAGRSQWNWEHGIPCRNPSCKSVNRPHPNCRCTSYGPQTGSSGGSGPAGPSKAQTSLYAEGGNVDAQEHPCSGVHKTDCEYYGGDPELGKSILKNAILRHSSEDDLTESMLGKSKPEMASHGLIASEGAHSILGDVGDSLFSSPTSKLKDLADKQLSKSAAKFINQISMTNPDEAMNPEFLKDTIRPAVKKLTGAANPHVVDAVITAISRGDTEKLGAVISHASKVSKGHKSIDNAIESLFSGGDIDQSPDGGHREKLKKFISQGGINAQIQNQSQAMNEQPVQAMAEGGAVTREQFDEMASRGKLNQATGKKYAGEEKAKTPIRMGRINGYSEEDIAHFYSKRRDGDNETAYEQYRADLETENSAVDSNAPQNPIEKAFPEQSMLLGATKSNVSNYLQQQQPEPAQKLPFDPDIKNAQKDRDYNKALDIANKPLSVLKHIQGGTILPEHVKHLVGMYPDLYNHLGKKATERITKAQLNDERPSYRVRQGLSMFLGSPLDSTMTPQAMQSIQAMYAAKAAPQTPPGKEKKGTSKLTDVAKDHFTQDQASSERAQATD